MWTAIETPRSNPVPLSIHPGAEWLPVGPAQDHRVGLPRGAPHLLLHLRASGSPVLAAAPGVQGATGGRPGFGLPVTGMPGSVRRSSEAGAAQCMCARGQGCPTDGRRGAHSPLLALASRPRRSCTPPDVQAAGTIHTDFERGFICAEVMHFDELKELGNENGALGLDAWGCCVCVMVGASLACTQNAADHPHPLRGPPTARHPCSGQGRGQVPARRQDVRRPGRRHLPLQVQRHRRQEEVKWVCGARAATRPRRACNNRQSSSGSVGHVSGRGSGDTRGGPRPTQRACIRQTAWAGGRPCGAAWRRWGT